MSRRAFALFCAIGIIWGLPYFLIRISVRELSPAFLVFARTFPATLLLLPMALHRGGWGDVVRRWKAVVAYTLIEFVVPWLMLFRAEQRLPSALSGLLVATVPSITLLLTHLSKSTDQFSLRQILGLGIGLVGVATLVGVDVHGAELLAVGEIGITAFGYALGPIVISRQLAGLPSVTVVTSSLAIGSIIYAPFALSNIPHHVTGEVVASVAGLSVACTAVAFLAFFALIAEVGATKATVVTYINPAVAVLLGVVALHEAFTSGFAVGFPLVLVGSYFATSSRTRSNRSSVTLPSQ